MSIKTSVKWHSIWLIAIFSLAIIGAGYIWQRPIKAQLNDWKLLPQPERFTELYFNDPASLPYTAARSSRLGFSFTIHNLEGSDQDYHYVVSFVPDTGVATIIDQNIRRIAADGSAIVTESYIYPGTVGRVVVELPDLDQSLHFSVIPQ
ncbi:MAG TPA: hypothetical protein VG941_00385 [Candidatus Paceibacterota bacterium]|nr:hypothetical protein [Candidatus Paceibacterota bacterium]